MREREKTTGNSLPHPPLYLFGSRRVSPPALAPARYRSLKPYEEGKEHLTYIDSAVPHVMHPDRWIVVGVRGGHVLRHHGAHPMDESLRRILALYASHGHRVAATGSRSRSVRVRNMMGSAECSWGAAAAAIVVIRVRIANPNKAVVIRIRPLMEARFRRRCPGQRDFLEE